jgi:hypothetical protein
MQQKPLLLSPKICFLFGFVISILFGGLSGPFPTEYQTVTNAVVSSVISGLYAALAFWFASVKRTDILFPLFCVAIGNTLGVTGISLFRDFDISFALVRMILSLILSGVAYQYFAKKIKNKK